MKCPTCREDFDPDKMVSTIVERVKGTGETYQVREQRFEVEKNNESLGPKVVDPNFKSDKDLSE